MRATQKPSSILPSFLLGQLLALVCFVCALMMTGAGHGWLAPFLFSLTGFLLYPIALIIRNNRDKVPALMLVFMLALAAFLDYMVYKLTVEEGLRYISVAGNLAYVWLGIWSIWQILILIELSRKVLGSKHIHKQP